MKSTLETRLGVFFALAVLAAVIILELAGAADLFRGGYQVTATFDTVQDLKKGDLVKMAGVQIGRVEKITLVASRAEVLMKIEDKYPISIDAEAVIKFMGLMGQYFVSIEGGTPESPVVDPKAGTGRLKTREQPDLSAIMAKLEEAAAGVKGVSDSFSMENLSTLIGPVTDFVKQNSAPVSAMIGNLKTVSDNLVAGKGTVGKLLNDDAFYSAAYTTVTNLQEASGDLKGFLAKAEGMITNANGMIEEVNAGKGTLGKLTTDPALYNEATTAMTNLRQILEKINQGQGSVGQLVNDESFLKNAKLTLQKVEKAAEGLEDQGPLSVLGIAVNALF